MPKNSNVKRVPFIGGLVAALSVLVVLGVTLGGHQAAAYSTQYINAQLLGGVQTAVSWDSTCWNSMHNSYFIEGYSARGAINNDGSYQGATWVSAAGEGAETTTNVNYGTKTVNLQLNAILFLCSSLVQPDGKGAGYSYSYSNGVVMSSGDANDRAPNPMGGNTNWPANTDNTFQVNSAWASDGGAVSLGGGQVLSYGRNDSSRYWFAQPIQFTYTSPSPKGITSTETIQIGVNGVSMVQYYGDEEFCVQNSNSENGFAYSLCPSTTSYFTITFQINPRYTLTPKIATQSVVQPGSSVSYTPTVSNAGPTPSNNANWQVTSFTLPPGVSPSVGAGTSSGSPASYYKNGAQEVSGGSGTYSVGDTPLASGIQTVPGLPVGSRVCFTFSVEPYNQTGSSTWSNSAPSCAVVAKQPKVQLLGGDLSAGDGFAGGMGAASDIVTGVTVEDGSGGSDTSYGSWDQYAASATGTITGFASGSAYENGLIGATSCNVSQLIFTNAGVGGCTSGTSLGYYASTESMPDVAEAFPATTKLSNNTINNVATVANGSSQSATGTVTINGGTLNAGQWLVLNAPTATVNITGNVTYTNATLNSIGQIPQLMIIANCVNISGGVTDVDAWIITQGAPGKSCDNVSGGGVLNTCSDVAAGGALSSAICNNTLQVNGPVMASHLYLQRTAGAGAGAAAGDPAEVFNLRPDAYLWLLARGDANGFIQPVQTIQLPPRF